MITTTRSRRSHRRPAAVLGAAAIVVTIAALAAFHPLPAEAQTTATGPTDSTGLVVRGIGRVNGTPDTVDITLGVETSAVTAAAALKDNNAKANQLVAMLKARGVADKDLQTNDLSVRPTYDQAGRRVTGYVVDNTITARLHDIAGAGALVDAAAAVAGDSIRVQSISFSIADTSKVLSAARKAAVADARTQSTELAAAAGAQLGRLRAIRTVSTNAAAPAVQFSKAAGVAADVAPAPVLAGSQEVVVQVDLVYDLA